MGRVANGNIRQGACAYVAKILIMMPAKPPVAENVWVLAILEVVGGGNEFGVD